MARARDERRGQIEFAIQSYENATEQYEDALALRKDCIDDVENRASKITNLLFIENFIRTIDEDAADEFKSQLEADAANQPMTVERDCIAFPIPQRPPVPYILIQEGLIQPGTPTPSAD